MAFTSISKICIFKSHEILAFSDFCPTWVPTTNIYCRNMQQFVRSVPDRRLRFATTTLTHDLPLTSVQMSVAGLGSIQFRNWNCSSIPIPIPELELELKLVELKMELELKSLELELELELKTGIEFFATATAALTS